MGDNPLILLQRFGQSFWYDNISREIINSGELRRMINEEGMRGVTSNPTIFHKSIKSSNIYDEQLTELFRDGNSLSEKEIFFSLAIKDISDACDIMMPVYEESRGGDGFVSIEVDPHLARDTVGTIREASSLIERIGRPNLMVKVPATREGIPAIEELTYMGHNINVTLLFAVKRYEEAIEAYLRGLERRASEGMPLRDISSVASFFVSRIDTLVDRLLQERIALENDEEARESLRSLKGRAAVANAKLAYQSFKKAFSTDRFLRLKLKEARIQRLLWGSTSTKNPEYRDVLYVEELIGSGTVNTMPDATLKAFKDHGIVRRTIDSDTDAAMATIRILNEVGIEMDRVTEELEEEGVRLFAESFDSIISLIEEKRKARG